MITNVSLVTVYCLDQDKARDFYVDVLGFEPRTDVTMGEGFRWVTVSHPSQPELEVTLMTPGPPLDAEAADFVRRQLEKGQMGGLGLQRRRLPQDLRGAVGKGVDVPAGALRPALRRRGGHARQLRQLAGARRAPGLHARGLHLS